MFLTNYMFILTTVWVYADKFGRFQPHFGYVSRAVRWQEPSYKLQHFTLQNDSGNNNKYLYSTPQLNFNYAHLHSTHDRTQHKIPIPRRAVGLPQLSS